MIRSSKRHRLTDAIIAKMIDNGIKDTHLRVHGIERNTMLKVRSGDASFMTLFMVQEVVEHLAKNK